MQQVGIERDSEVSPLGPHGRCGSTILPIMLCEAVQDPTLAQLKIDKRRGRRELHLHYPPILRIRSLERIHWRNILNRAGLPTCTNQSRALVVVGCTKLKYILESSQIIVGCCGKTF
jgi:hypothetical protein